MGYGMPIWEIFAVPGTTIALWVDNEYGIVLEEESIDDLYAILTEHIAKRRV